MTDTAGREPRQYSDEELQDLVASADSGARAPDARAVAWLIAGLALAWSLFQLWIAQPQLWFGQYLPVLNSSQTRPIHLTFAIVLAFLAYPAFKSSPRHRIPIADWALALIGGFCAFYVFWFSETLALTARSGLPTQTQVIIGAVGIVVLLEASRRALGPALTIVGSLFLAYAYFGQGWLIPDLIEHEGLSFTALINAQWLDTGGVFGIPLGVSTAFVFLFVLFGSLLDKAGAGNYFIKLAFAGLGHLRGGPAKAAVVGSAMTGVISGSSIANVVTTGTFTIPLMKRVGFSAEKSGAVEVASSVNGQIMPPVMGAAAFLMVEYVGIPYFDVVTHAILPAAISYIALVYIVHLEAMKAGFEGLPRAYTPKPIVQRLIGMSFIIFGICALSLAVYYGMGWIRPAFGDAAGYIVFALLVAAYVALLFVASKEKPLKMEDPNEPVQALPLPGPTIRSGLHYILPVVVLVWALMVDRLSPGLSAFWAAAFMIFILVTQRPLMSLMRGEGAFAQAVRQGILDLFDGLISGARNMIGIGIATATAGIIVGAVSQTGVGSALANVVEALSGGNIMAILFLTAILSLILGMGLPTTANYIVVSALLAPVIVTLGQQNGLIVPLIAVHLFVFYFGIMADVTPPVGLASFAAAAVSGGDPIKTGVVAFFYSLRTAALPFLFIFNTELLLIDVDMVQGIFVFIIATCAMLLFAAATQGFFIARSRFYESILLLLVAFSLFRPGFWMDMVFAPYTDVAPSEIAEAAAEAPAGEYLRLKVAGVNDVGDPIEFTALLPIGNEATGQERLDASGVTLIDGDDNAVIVDDVAFDSPAQDAGLDWDQQILSVQVPNEQPTKYLVFIPALAILALVILMQRARAPRRKPAAAA
ncbi:TRAP transporter permease [Roseitalea porphyridii]|uniref:TRAP transporter permease n=1 Tax=Roseitalea porphyridii TaxID=1852022 RepID=UPI0032ECA163